MHVYYSVHTTLWLTSFKVSMTFTAWLPHTVRTVQTIVENVYVWLVGPQHPVSEHKWR